MGKKQNNNSKKSGKSTLKYSEEQKRMKNKNKPVVTQPDISQRISKEERERILLSQKRTERNECIAVTVVITILLLITVSPVLVPFAKRIFSEHMTISEAFSVTFQDLEYRMRTSGRPTRK